MTASYLTENAIIELFADHKELSTDELRLLLAQEHNLSLSLSQLYRIIQRLQKQFVLIKKDSSITLNMIWVNHMNFLTNKIKALHTENLYDGLTMKEGEVRHYKANTFKQIATIKSNLSAQIMSNYQSVNYYVFNNRLYHILANKSTTLRLSSLVCKRVHTLYSLVGNDGPTDHYAAQLYDQNIGTIYRKAFTTDHPFPQHGYRLQVIGDYILERFAPESFWKPLEYYFTKKEPFSQEDGKIFEQFYTIKGDFRGTITRDHQRATQIKELFHQYFPFEATR